MSKSEKNSKNNFYFSLAILPFITLILIGLIDGDFTYHVRVFKTLLIFIFDFFLLFVFFIKINLSRKFNFEKKQKFIFYYLLYFIYIFIQYLISFVSGETNFNREYFLANYIVLLIFSMLVYLLINDLNDINLSLLVISIFFIILIIWAVNAFFSFREILTIKKAFFPDVNVNDMNLSSSEKSELIVKALKKLGGFVSNKEIFNSFRPDFSFGNTDYFSGYAVGLLPLAFITPIIFFDKRRNIFKNWISFLTMLVALVSIVPLVLSQSRAALFGFYIGMVIIFIPAFLIILFKKLKFLF